nr:hypothetical protein [Mucilaginibacter sp. SP1R1]
MAVGYSPDGITDPIDRVNKILQSCIQQTKNDRFKIKNRITEILNLNSKKLLN